MKKTLIAAALMLAAFSASAQEVSYALPKTTLTVEVGYSQDIVHAGKYAKYAKDLLNLEVAQADTVITTINQFKIRPRVEADQTKRYSVNLSGNTRPTLLSLTEQGLISASEGEIKENGGSRHSASPLGRQVNYRKHENFQPAPMVKKTYYEERFIPIVDTLGNTVIDTVLVEVEPIDSLLLEAQLAAGKIKQYRDQRYKILTGDTDASYAGEALGTAITELTRLENELLPLFEGTTETAKGRAYFDVTPDREGSLAVFALDPTRGPVKATKPGANVFELTIKAEPMTKTLSGQQSKKQPAQKIVYLIPAICDITLTDGTDEIMSLRAPVYQLGLETSYPLYD